MSDLYDLTSQKSWIHAKTIRIEYCNGEIVIQADNKKFIIDNIKQIYDMQQVIQNCLTLSENEPHHGVYRGILDLLLSAKNKYFEKREFKCIKNLS